MDVSTRQGQVYAFGPFLLDPVRRVLTCVEAPVALTGTVFDTLLYLVEHSARIVSKTELLDAIWPRKVVEEANVTQTIFTLRKALASAGATEPLIVTAPGQGYRFAALVRTIDRSHVRLPLGVIGSVGPAPAFPKGAALAARPFPPAAVRMMIGVFALISAAGLGLAGWFIWSNSGSAGQPLVVLEGFKNLSNNPLFDKTLAMATRIDLMQSPHIRLLSEDTVQDTLVEMTRPPDQALTPATAMEVCARNNGQAVITGDIAQFGSRYLLSLVAAGCVDGRNLAVEKAEAASPESLLPTIDLLVRRLRRSLGESHASVERSSVPLQRRQTASLDALQAYSDAYDAVAHGQRLQAVPLFQRAIALDPGFALAHSDLGITYWNLREIKLAKEQIAQAYALRDTVGERERATIDKQYATAVSKDVPTLIAALRTAATLDPSVAETWGDLSNEETWIGQFQAAIEDGRRAVALDPRAESVYADLARAYLHAGQTDQAQRVLETAEAKHIDGDDTHRLLFQVAAVHGDVAAEARELAWADGKPAGRDLLIAAGEAAFARGQPAQGQADFDRARSLDKSAGLADIYAAPNARLLYDMGLPDQARASLARVAPGYDSADYRFSLAEFGDEALARSLLARDLKDAPADTLLHTLSAPEVQAAIDLRHGQPRAAIAALAPALAYDFHAFDIPYERGQAYLAAGDGAHAALEFHKIVDHPGVEADSPHLPLAQLGLGRAYRLTGDRVRARAAYQRFLEAWADAEPNMPLVAAAKAELAGLGNASAG